MPNEINTSNTYDELGLFASRYYETNITENNTSTRISTFCGIPIFVMSDEEDSILIEGEEYV